MDTENTGACLFFKTRPFCSLRGFSLNTSLGVGRFALIGPLVFLKGSDLASYRR